MNTAQTVGITKDTEEEPELDETTIRVYVEWEGSEFYTVDRVKILYHMVS